MTRSIKIVPQVVAQGSWGIHKYNRRTGELRPGPIRVWHLVVDGKSTRPDGRPWGIYPTRQEARDRALFFGRWGPGPGEAEDEPGD